MTPDQASRGRPARGGSALLVVSLALVALAAGCTTKAWYEGMRFRAESECRRQPPGDSERCLARLNTMSYEDYDRNRVGKGPVPGDFNVQLYQPKYAKYESIS